MKKYITLLSSVAIISLSGCTWNNPDIVKPEPQIVRQVEYVIRIPPAQLLTLPLNAAKIDIDKAKQSDAAKMLIASEERMKQLENQIIGIGEFFTSESEKLNKKATEINAETLNSASKK